jgi:secondary thiamine-phosphate synthase enzyme
MMTVITKQLSIQSKEEGEIIDITNKICKTVSETNLKNGNVTVFVSGSTGALTTIEYEPGLIQDLPNIMERIAPKDLFYEHERRWHDGNGHSHIKATLIGPSLTIPFVNGRLTLGTWQQIIFVEFDIRSRSRKIIIQIIGE